MCLKIPGCLQGPEDIRHKEELKSGVYDSSAISEKSDLLLWFRHYNMRVLSM